MTIYLERIKLKNFRTFGSLGLELAGTPGLVIVSGPNGLGKSSFFDAIEWALTSRILHFEDFIAKGITEADYLTREQSPRFSHSVELGFSGLCNVERHGDSGGATGTTDEEIKKILVSSSWGQPVEDLSTYLALTHFQGQGAMQRFMSRDASEQWRALRVPSGVEKLEEIRRRLRGKSATIAINRKSESLGDVLSQYEEELARWDSLIERLRRLEGLSEASGALSRDQILAAAKQLLINLAHPLKKESSAATTDAAALLSEVRHGAFAQLKMCEETESKIAGVERLPSQFDQLKERASAIGREVEASRAATSENEEALASLRANAEELDAKRRSSESKLQRLRERASMLRAAMADVQEAETSTERLRAVDKAMANAEGELQVLRSEIATWERDSSLLQAAQEKVSLARKMVTSAGNLSADVDAVREMELELREAQDNVGRLLGASPSALGDSWDKAVDLAAQEVSSVRARVEEVRAKTDAISAAVAVIASHLNAHDDSCPVCRTSFDPGVLKSLVEESAADERRDLAGLEQQLTLAERGLEEARRARSDAMNAHSEIERARQTAASRDVAWRSARALVLERLQPSDQNSDLVALAAARVNDAKQNLRLASESLASLTGSFENVREMLEDRKRRLSQMDSVVEDLRAQQSRLAAEIAAAGRRFNLRASEDGLQKENIPALLAAVETEVDGATGSIQSEALAFERIGTDIAALRGEQVRLAMLTGEHERMRAEVDEELKKLAQLWVSCGLAMPPSMSELGNRLASFRKRRADLQSLLSEQQRLAACLQQTSATEELESVRYSVAVESGDRSTFDHRAWLESRVAYAREQKQKVESVRGAIGTLAVKLQSEADSFSSQFLEPLNDLIGAFNDSLLTNSGTSVAFNADYYSDRTQFSASVRRRRHGETANSDVRPQLILSEGQLAANGFSILCSASVSYRWSTWRALLLDDPLQHNDVIHAAAFTDVMRNLVELEGYQILMSSHDRSETEFIERKFTAAGLPCTVVQLLSDSPDGVTSEVRNNAYARSSTLESERLVG